MKNEIKKGEIITRTFSCCSDTVVYWEALNDAVIGKFIKLRRVYAGGDGEHEIIKKKVCNGCEGAYISF